MAKLTIDPSKIPWGHTVDIRGVEVPLLHPNEVDADNAGQLPPGWINLPRRVLLWLRVKTFGRWPVGQLRRDVAALVPARFRGMIDDLTGFELLVLQDTYLALQTDGVREATKANLTQVIGERLEREPPASPAPQSQAHRHPQGSQAPQNGRTRTHRMQVAQRADSRLPDALGGFSVLCDNCPDTGQEF